MMELIGERDCFLNLEGRGSFKVHKKEPFDADVSRQENRMAIRLFIESGYASPGEYPGQVEIRVERNYSLQVDGVTHLGSIGDRRTLPRKVAAMLVARFAAVPINKGLWSPTREPEISEDSIVKLHDGAANAQKENWVTSWRS